MRVASLTLLLVLLFAQDARAQLGAGVEVRGGVAIPVGSFENGIVADAGLAPGASFSVHLAVPRGTRGALLFGFAQHRFRCTGDGCSGAGDVVSTGWSLGTRLALRPGLRPPWMRLAMVFDRSEWTFPEGDALERRASYLGLGGEAGIGLTMQLRPRLTLLPGVRYALVNTHFPRGEPLLMHYLLADLGVLFAF